MGDPTGIGPYITVDALSKLSFNDDEVIVIGSEQALNRHPLYEQVIKRVQLCDVSSDKIPAGKASYEYLLCAIDLLKKNAGASLVTAPVSKEKISSFVEGFVGHTEFLAEKCDVSDVVMLMAGTSMKTVLLTRHISLSEVSGALNKASIVKTIEITAKGLKNYFGITKPRFAFCSVNPHAGVGTFVKKEDQLIVDAINSLQIDCQCYGPYPSDTLYVNAGDYDVIFAAYHDQAMIPFKLLEFSTGVNVTLGLPFLRTSPAHGTAFDIVDTPEKIDSSSMQAAIEMVMR